MQCVSADYFREGKNGSRRCVIKDRQVRIGVQALSSVNLSIVINKIKRADYKRCPEASTVENRGTDLRDDGRMLAEGHKDVVSKVNPVKYRLSR
jgi:hypothetical protein